MSQDWSDLFVVPVGLSWGLDQFDTTLTYGFYAPTGKYETGGSDNIGTGFLDSSIPGLRLLLSSHGNQSTAIMVGLTYELNSTIKDADITPGSRFSLELAVSQYLSERFEVGVHGSVNWQVGDDTGKMYSGITACTTKKIHLLSVRLIGPGKTGFM